MVLSYQIADDHSEKIEHLITYTNTMQIIWLFCLIKLKYNAIIFRSNWWNNHPIWCVQRKGLGFVVVYKNKRNVFFNPRSSNSLYVNVFVDLSDVVIVFLDVCVCYQHDNIFIFMSTLSWSHSHNMEERVIYINMTLTQSFGIKLYASRN